MILPLILAALLCGPWTTFCMFLVFVLYRATLARIARSTAP